MHMWILRCSKYLPSPEIRNRWAGSCLSYKISLAPWALHTKRVGDAYNIQGSIMFFQDSLVKFAWPRIDLLRGSACQTHGGAGRRPPTTLWGVPKDPPILNSPFYLCHLGKMLPPLETCLLLFLSKLQTPNFTILCSVCNYPCFPD